MEVEGHTGIFKDLVKVQSELKPIAKDSVNPFFKSKYASLDKITEHVFPILTEHGFSFVAMPSTSMTDEPTLKYGLYHESGNSIQGEMKLMLKSQDPQAQGSAITYARRYALCAMLGIVADEDDDGNKGGSQGNQTESHGSPATEGSKNPTAPPSEKQLLAIRDMLKKKGAETLGDVKKILHQVTLVDSIDDLSKSEASVVLDFLYNTESEKIKEILYEGVE